MATIHKLTKDGSTIFPATIADAVVHQDTGKTLTSMIKDYNVSELFPSEGIDGGNKYNLALAISVLGTHLTAAEKTGGISITFISSATGYPEEEYFLNKNTWSTNVADWGQRFEVGDVIADPSGSWIPGTAEAYIDQKVAEINTEVVGENLARQAADSSLQTQINTEVSTRSSNDTAQNTRLGVLEEAYRNLTESDVIVGPRPSSGQQANVIYREPDQGHNPPQFYSDYMWYNSSWVLMATYNNGIDDNPLPTSNNLVKSSGVFKNMGAFDISAYTGNTYPDLAGALAVVPSTMQAGGMSVKFIQTIPAKYSVVRTAGLTTQPSGISLSSDPNIVSGTYTAAQLSNLNSASALPSTLNSSKTYYLTVSGSPTTYTSWVVTYVQTSDNKYVQYRLMADAFSTTVLDWQGVDTEVTPNSKNLIESGAVLNALKNGGAISLNKCFINGVINEITGEIVAGYSKRLVFPFRIKGKYLSKLNVDQTNSTIKFWIGLYIYSSGSDVPTWSAYQKTDKFSWNFDADKEYNLLARNSTDTNVSPSDLKDMYFSVYSEIENREEEEFNENVVERLDKNEFDIKNLSVMTENKDIKSLIINAVIDDNTGEITKYGYSKRAVLEDKLSGDIISFLNINQEQSTQKIYVGLYTYASEDAVPVWSSFRTTDSIIIPFEKGKYYNILIRTAEDSAFDVSDLADISFGFEFRRDSEILNLHPYDKEAEVVSSIARGFHNDSSSSFDVNPLVLMWCSDLHRNVENEKRLLAFKDRYATYLDDAIHTGDLVNFYGDDVATYVNTPFCDNFLLCLGDHEYYDHKEGSTWVLASQSDVYNKYIAPFKNNWSGCVFPESGVSYYYKDYTAKKVRLIVLDFEDYSPSSAQATWLSERLAETLDNSGNAAGFHVVIAVHRTPFRTVMNAKNPFNSLEFNVADGGTVSSDISAKVNTYIGQSGSHFACYLTGHQHIDHFGVGIQYGNQLNITVGTGDDAAGSNTQNIERVKGTDSQDLFNIIAVDTYNSTIRLARIGAKYDRYGREKKTLCYYYGNEAFDSSVSYTRAKIVEYDSKLYMFTGNHSGVWTGDDVVEIDRLMYC